MQLLVDKKELEIESIETPKGNVPTVKGLETVANHIIDQVTPLEKSISSIGNDISSIKRTLDAMSKVVHSFGENFGELLLLLAKVDDKINQSLKQLEEGKIANIKEQQHLLIELQTIIAKTLLQFQQLPLELHVRTE